MPEPRSTGPCGTRLALSKITKRTSKWEVLFCYPRSARLFSKHNCFAVWIRFLGALKRPSVVPVPRSTGPYGTRLALFYFVRKSVFIWLPFCLSLIFFEDSLKTNLLTLLLSAFLHILQTIKCLVYRKTVGKIQLQNATGSTKRSIIGGNPDTISDCREQKNRSIQSKMVCINVS